MTREKDRYIETLRGLTILLVVVSHVIGMDASGGMRVSDDSVWRYLYFTLCSNHITIPLFTALAGWVYALKPVRKGAVGHFLVKKARRLLLPLIFTGTLYYLLQALTPGANQIVELKRIWCIYLYPHSIFWYLPALFLIFCLMAFIDARGCCGKLRRWAGWLAVSIVGSVTGHLAAAHIPNLFGIWGAMSVLPYFLLGAGVCRFRDRLATPPLRRLYLAGLVVSFAALQAVWFTLGNVHLLLHYYLHIPLSLLSTAFLLSWRQRPAVCWLEQLGHHAYTIYLFHVFGTAGGRILLAAFNIHNQTIVFAVSLTLGMAVPLAVDKIAERGRMVARLFLGR